jgi:hypothetical protein
MTSEGLTGRARTHGGGSPHREMIKEMPGPRTAREVHEGDMRDPEYRREYERTSWPMTSLLR